MSDQGSGSSSVVPVKNIGSATLVVDTMGEIMTITYQNIDPANDVYWSQDRLQLESSPGLAAGLTTPPNVGIKIAANGGSDTLMFFRGRMFAVALNATVGIRLEVTPIFNPQILSELMDLMRGLTAKAKSA